jgi:four helix bundle protein
MALYKLEELVAYQLAMDLKQQVFRLLYNSPAARDLKLAGQISDAVSSLPSDISEGYYRFNPSEADAKRRSARPAQRPPRTARRRHRRGEE